MQTQGCGRGGGGGGGGGVGDWQAKKVAYEGI